MPRGGKRYGTPGKAYGNRSDLRVPNMQAPSPQYGVRAQQQAAQRAVPIAAPATDVPPPPTAPAGGAAPAGAGGALGGGGALPVLPGQVTPLDAPTERPDEPVTAGVPLGPGPGPEALGPLGAPGSPDDEVMALRAAYAAYPSEELRQILERIDLE